MANPKPQMYAEQQTMFKQAVNQGVLKAVSYAEYCAITPEEAERIFKSIKGKVDFNKPLPEKGARNREAPAREKAPDFTRRPDANEPATARQIETIDKGVADGIIEEPGEKIRKNITKAQASEIIKEIHARRPSELASLSQKDELVRLVKTGRIYPMKAETFYTLTKAEASERISIGKQNERDGKTVEGYDPNYVPKRNQPATAEMKNEIKELVAGNWLNRVSREKWPNLTQEEAGRLIYTGRQRCDRGEPAPPPEHSQNRNQEGPAQETTSQREASTQVLYTSKSQPSIEDDIPF